MNSTLKNTIVKDIKQYNEYCERHEALTMKCNDKDADELALLELLIEDYDKRIIKQNTGNLNPVELLRSLLRDSSISQVELSKSINVSRQLISDVLNYRRNISKEMVIKLSQFFSMSQDAFGREYNLKVGERDLKSKRAVSGV